MRKCSRWVVIPPLPKGRHFIPLQKEKRQKELEHEKEERKTRKLKEKLEVRCDPHPF